MARSQRPARTHAHTVLLTCGYGLFLAFYSLCAQWGSPSLAAAAPAYGFFQSVMRWCIVGGFAISLIWSLRRPGGVGFGFRRMGSLIGILGLLFFGFIETTAGDAPAIACMTAVLLGVSAATLNACWVDALKNQCIESAQTVLAASTVCVGVLGLASEAFFAFDAEIPVVAMTLLELAVSLVVLHMANPDPCASSELVQSTTNAVLAYIPTLKGLVPVLACSLIAPLLQAMAGMMLTDQTLSASTHNLLWCVGEIVAGIVLLVLWRMHDSGTDTGQIAVLCLPILTTLTVLFPFLGDAYWPVLFLFSEIMRATILGSAVAACLRATERRRLNPVVPYSLIALLMLFVDLVACALGPLVVSVTPASNDRARLVGLLFAFALVYTLLVVFLSRRNLVGGLGKPGGQTVANAPGVDDSVGKDGGVPTKRAGEPYGCSANASPSQAGEAFEYAVPTSDLASACARVAAAFGLSAREAEVLALQARGRNVPFIAEELGVSPATVRSYVKRIHQALGVHTQQELIDFVEAR